MRKVTRTLLATTAVAGLLALPVAGATAGDNTVTFTVATNNSGISISHDTTAVDLTSGGDAVFDLTDQGVSGNLPATTVTDARGLLGSSNGWTVTVSSNGDWVNQSDASQTVGAANGRVYLNAADAGSLETALGGALTGMVLTGGEFNTPVNDLSNPYTLLSGYSTSLTTAEVTYTPAIAVTIPGSTAPGIYSAIITQDAA